MVKKKYTYINYPMFLNKVRALKLYFYSNPSEGSSALLGAAEKGVGGWTPPRGVPSSLGKSLLKAQKYNTTPPSAWPGPRWQATPEPRWEGHVCVIRMRYEQE